MSGTAGVTEPSFLAKLFRKKNLDTILADSQNQEHKLKKSLSAFDLVIFGVGAMIGAGIFALTGSAAVGDETHIGAGPALTISFILTGFICGFCALAYAEFAAMAPISGSAYTYTFSTLGEFVAWIIGWALVLEYAVGNMAVAVAWTGHLNEFLANNFHMELLPAISGNTITTVKSLQGLDPGLILTSIPFTIPFTTEEYLLVVQQAFNLPAALIVLAVTSLLLIGVSESARMAAVMVFMKTAVILLVIGAGTMFLVNGNMETLHTNWFAEGWDTFSPNGFKGIITGASMIFFAYIGFDAVSTAAEETKNPQKDVPIGILGSLAICTILYILVTAVITGLVPLDKINKEAAVASAMEMINNPWASQLVLIGAIAGLTSVLLVLQMGGTRIFYSISRDGLLPQALSKIHPKFQTPHICTIMTGVFVALGAGMLPITLLAEMCNIGTLAAFVVVCLGVTLLRFTDPHRNRPFKCPLGVTLPIIGIVGCIFVMTGLPLMTWVVTAGWFVLGMILYFSYGFHHSKLNNPSPNDTNKKLEAA